MGVGGHQDYGNIKVGEKSSREISKIKSILKALSRKRVAKKPT